MRTVIATEKPATFNEWSREMFAPTKQTEDLINKLARFERDATPAMFVEVFGEKQGTHLFSKFGRGSHSLLGLWNLLDEQNRRALINKIL